MKEPGGGESEMTDVDHKKLKRDKRVTILQGRLPELDQGMYGPTSAERHRAKGGEAHRWKGTSAELVARERGRDGPMVKVGKERAGNSRKRQYKTGEKRLQRNRAYSVAKNKDQNNNVANRDSHEVGKSGKKLGQRGGR